MQNKQSSHFELLLYNIKTISFSMKHQLKCYLLVMLIFISCNLKNEKSKIYNKENAITTYEEFQNKLHNTQLASTNDLLNKLEEWRILEDTVLHYLISDSIQDQTRNVQDMTRCAVIRNGITTEIIRLTDSQLRTYGDIIDVQQSFNDYNLNDRYPDTFHNAECFFNRLIIQKHKDKNAHEIMTQYTNQLLYWKSKEFSSKHDMLEFIKEEDYHFSYFLDHLYDYDSRSVKSIITMTDNISKLMYESAKTGKLDMNELKIYLGIRTNRRLIQNANKCASAIRLKQIKTPEQAEMTVSILLNPYSNYNRMCAGMRTKEQTKALHSLGKEIPSLLNYLKQQGLIRKNISDSLPNMMIKEHILITMK